MDQTKECSAPGTFHLVTFLFVAKFHMLADCIRRLERQSTYHALDFLLLCGCIYAVGVFQVTLLFVLGLEQKIQTLVIHGAMEAWISRRKFSLPAPPTHFRLWLKVFITAIMVLDEFLIQPIYDSLFNKTIFLIQNLKTQKTLKFSFKNKI